MNEHTYGGETLRADIEAFNKERSGSSDNLRGAQQSPTKGPHLSQIIEPAPFKATDLSPSRGEKSGPRPLNALL